VNDVDVDDNELIEVNVPDELVLRYTLYPVALVTVNQLTVMLLDDTATAETLDGELGGYPPPVISSKNQSHPVKVNVNASVNASIADKKSLFLIKKTPLFL